MCGGLARGSGFRGTGIRRACECLCVKSVCTYICTRYLHTTYSAYLPRQVSVCLPTSDLFPTGYVTPRHDRHGAAASFRQCTCTCTCTCVLALDERTVGRWGQSHVYASGKCKCRCSVKERVDDERTNGGEVGPAGQGRVVVTAAAGAVNAHTRHDDIGSERSRTGRQVGGICTWAVASRASGVTG